MRADEAPEGMILHSAGQGEQGFYVYDVWESREAFDRFMEEKLGPAMAEAMGGPPPEGGAPQFFPSMFWSPQAEPTTRTRNS